MKLHLSIDRSGIRLQIRWRPALALSGYSAEKVVAVEMRRGRGLQCATYTALIPLPDRVGACYARS